MVSSCWVCACEDTFNPLTEEVAQVLCKEEIAWETRQLFGSIGSCETPQKCFRCSAISLSAKYQWIISTRCDGSHERDPVYCKIEGQFFFKI